MPVRSSGTVMAKRHVALSAGVSLLGNHERAPSGSLSTHAPPRVGNQPAPAANGRAVS